MTYLDGNPAAKIYVISDALNIQDRAEQKPLTGYREMILKDAFSKAGVSEDDYCIDVLGEGLKERLLLHPRTLLVLLGEAPLQAFTDKKSIHKYHLSILTTRAEYGGTKAIPLLHPTHILRSYKDVAYMSVGAQKVKFESQSPLTRIPDRRFLLGPSFDDSMSYLREKVLPAPEIAVDVETGRGQINTVGFAISPTEAIALKVGVDVYGDEKHYQLWSMIDEIMASPSRKIFQNYMYDVQYLSRYGIFTNNIHHDTMWCMKFLHPELEMGLANIGRIYTPFPYWKEDGKDWNKIDNWQEHLAYNCKDTTGTFWAYREQVQDLKARNLDKLFYGFVMRFADPIREMCTRGLLINQDVRTEMLDQCNEQIESLMKQLNTISHEKIGSTFNPRSPQQMKSALKQMGFNIPVDKGKETTDKKALIKLRKSKPKEPIFDVLLKLSKQNKQRSSYLEFRYDHDSRVRYSLNGCGTETGRWAGHKDPWSRGFNPQTVPKSMRRMFISDPGKTFVQIDLAQAESRYVAWESPEPRLMKMLTEGEDVHKYVASRIFNIPASEVTKEQRQLGKKSGHAANYGVGPKTFSEACLVEMGLDVSLSEAKRIISTYFEVFPGIKKRQFDIQQKIRASKKLTTPLGRERYFYDRISDSLFREAYAYAPQSTIPDIINHLMLYIFDVCDMHLQVHDSLLVAVEDYKVPALVARCREIEKWHPKITLPGGRLTIPIDIEVGKSWGEMRSI